MNDWIYKEDKIPYCKHKYFNLQIGWYLSEDFYDYFDFTCKWTRRQDHAGFNFEIGLLKFYFIFYTYDHRHWDMYKKCYTENNCWMEDEDENLDETK